MTTSIKVKPNKSNIGSKQHIQEKIKSNHNAISQSIKSLHVLYVYKKLDIDTQIILQGLNLIGRFKQP